MQRLLFYAFQPGVVSTGLWGIVLQVALAFANSFNIGGAADAIANYGLSGQLASGGLIAALVGAYYSFSQRKTNRVMATGAGAVAGGISGTLGTGLTQAFGWTEVAAGTTPLLNFTGDLGRAHRPRHRHRSFGAARFGGDVRHRRPHPSLRHDGRRRRYRRAPGSLPLR